MPCLSITTASARACMVYGVMPQPGGKGRDIRFELRLLLLYENQFLGFALRHDVVDFNSNRLLVIT